VPTSPAPNSDGSARKDSIAALHRTKRPEEAEDDEGHSREHGVSERVPAVSRGGEVDADGDGCGGPTRTTGGQEQAEADEQCHSGGDGGPAETGRLADRPVEVDDGGEEGDEQENSGPVGIEEYRLEEPVHGDEDHRSLSAPQRDGNREDGVFADDVRSESEGNDEDAGPLDHAEEGSPRDVSRDEEDVHHQHESHIERKSGTDGGRVVEVCSEERDGAEDVRGYLGNLIEAVRVGERVDDEQAETHEEFERSEAGRESVPPHLSREEQPEEQRE
jgi:hypothetical protein